jgi:hypothetical protein
MQTDIPDVSPGDARHTIRACVSVLDTFMVSLSKGISLGS